MTLPTFRQLTVFDAIARLGSVTAAANEIALTQSAASMALKQLEILVGEQLFLRVGKRLVLSKHGKTLQPMVRSILLSMREIPATLRSELPRDQLNIGASPTVGEYLLNDATARFLAAHPWVRLNIVVKPAFDVISAVDDMELDIGLVEFISVRPTLDVRRWLNSQHSIFCHPEHPLLQRRRLRAYDLRNERWCLQHRFADSRRQFTLAILSRLQTIEVVLQSDSINTIKHAVSRGIGLGCLPHPCVAKEIESGSLGELHPTDLDLNLPFSIVMRKDVRRSAAQLAFLDTLEVRIEAN